MNKATSFPVWETSEIGCMAPEAERTFQIRAATAEDDAAWARLRTELWPHCSVERHAVEREIYLRSPGIVALAVAPDGPAFGFAEVSIRRDHVTGTSTPEVPFLEGWYVSSAWRQAGVGRALIRFVADWALDQGFQELGSDVEWENTASQDAHLKLGFVETERSINYLLRLAN